VLDVGHALDELLHLFKNGLKPWFKNELPDTNQSG
jgi:hypothetical protein